MIRVVLFLLAVAVLALGAAWIADRPGDVTVIWLGQRIETSVSVALAAVALACALAVMLWSAFRLLLASPRRLARMMHERRRNRGYRAIARGLIAVGAGDVRAALRFGTEAKQLAAGDPLALLLAAQTAQLSGDRAAAETAFRAMAARHDTRLLGLHGLFVEARRRADAAEARGYAEQAVQVAPTLSWANRAVLEFRCAGHEWIAAEAMLDGNLRAGLIDRATHRRQRAVLLTARAREAAETHPEEAKTLAIEAARLAPDLVPAAALAGQMLADGGEPRKAAKILETAWRISPHPDLADVYADLRPGDTARDRLARIQALVRKPEGHIEGALAVARAALDAREFKVARDALAPFLAAPTQRVALLMAEIEEVEHGDEGRAREWTARAVRARRDPAWTADGVVSDHWLPVSPVTARLDAFAWRVPVAEAAPPGPVIETGASLPAAAARSGTIPPGTPAAAEPALSGDGGAAEQGGTVPPGTAATAEPARSGDGAAAGTPRLPDDPGPDPARAEVPPARGRSRLWFLLR